MENAIERAWIADCILAVVERIEILPHEKLVMSSQGTLRIVKEETAWTARGWAVLVDGPFWEGADEVREKIEAHLEATLF